MNIKDVKPGEFYFTPTPVEITLRIANTRSGITMREVLLHQGVSLKVSSIIGGKRARSVLLDISLEGLSHNTEISYPIGLFAHYFESVREGIKRGLITKQ